MISVPAFAEENIIRTFYSCSLIAGFNVFDLNDLNDNLDKSGVEDFLPITPAVGLEAFGLVKERVLVGGNALFYQQNKIGNQVDASLYGWYGTVNAGYVALESKYYLLAPLVGIGWISNYLKITGDIEKIGFLSSEYKKGKNDLLLSQGGVVIKVGLDFYGLVPTHHRYFGFGAIPFGIHLGYMFLPIISEWYDEKTDLYLKDGPVIELQSVYLLFSVGFGAGSLHVKNVPEPTPQPGE